MVCAYRGDDEFDFKLDESTPSPADYNTNPATPGYQPDTPSPQGPYTPQTPGSAYSPYGQPSPSPTSYNGECIGLTPLHIVCYAFPVIFSVF